MQQSMTDYTVTYGGSLAQIGRQLEREHVAAIIADQHNGVVGVEGDTCQLALLGDLLLAQRLVLVNGEIVHKHLCEQSG